MSLKNELQTQKDNSIFGLIKQQGPQFKMALGSAIDPERFVRVAMTAVRTNPTLGQCTAPSLLGGLMQSAQLQLEPNTPLGHAYIIPRKNKGIWEANFQIGYKGYLRMFYNHPNTEFIYSKEVHANDSFSYQFGTMPSLSHKPSTGERGAVTHVYAVAKFSGKTPMFEVMTTEEINEHAKRFSQSFDKGFSPWKSHWPEMAKKTVLLRLLKMCPLSIEQERVVAQDDTIKHYNGENIQDTIDVTDYSEIEIEPSDLDVLMKNHPEQYAQAVKQLGHDPESDDDVEKIKIMVQEIMAA